MDSITIIKSLISNNINKSNDTNNLFDIIVNEINNYADNMKATDMIQLKIKSNDKKIKGDLFEALCYLYIKNILCHDMVWLYKDFPLELKTELSLTVNDYGIDIISKKNNDYYAIQCKFKKPSAKVQLISWKSLSTFYAMVNRSGPWNRYITMTNVNGCKHIGKKQEKDWSICIGTFKKLSHFDWLKFIDSSNNSINDLLINNNKINDLSLNDIREKRLKYYESLNNKVDI